MRWADGVGIVGAEGGFFLKKKDTKIKKMVWHCVMVLCRDNFYHIILYYISFFLLLLSFSPSINAAITDTHTHTHTQISIVSLYHTKKKKKVQIMS